MNNEIKHTPGIWYKELVRDRQIHTVDPYKPICTIDDTNPNREADAAIIAAAPDMYQLLKELKNLNFVPNEDNDKMWTQVALILYKIGILLNRIEGVQNNNKNMEFVPVDVCSNCTRISLNIMMGHEEKIERILISEEYSTEADAIMACIRLNRMLDRIQPSDQRVSL